MSSRLRALKSVKKIVYPPEAGIGGLTILTPLNSLITQGPIFVVLSGNRSSEKYSIYFRRKENGAAEIKYNND